jgi:hypothetical protein
VTDSNGVLIGYLLANGEFVSVSDASAHADGRSSRSNSGKVVISATWLAVIVLLLVALLLLVCVGVACMMRVAAKLRDAAVDDTSMHVVGARKSHKRARDMPDAELALALDDHDHHNFDDDDANLASATQQSYVDVLAMPVVRSGPASASRTVTPLELHANTGVDPRALHSDNMQSSDVDSSATSAAELAARRTSGSTNIMHVIEYATRGGTRVHTSRSTDASTPSLRSVADTPRSSVEALLSVQRVASLPRIGVLASLDRASPKSAASSPSSSPLRSLTPSPSPPPRIYAVTNPDAVVPSAPPARVTRSRTAAGSAISTTTQLASSTSTSNSAPASSAGSAPTTLRDASAAAPTRPQLMKATVTHLDTSLLSPQGTALMHGDHLDYLVGDEIRCPRHGWNARTTLPQVDFDALEGADWMLDDTNLR